MDIKEILSVERGAKDIIRDLKRKSTKLRSWVELEKEYNPDKHPVNDKGEYPDIPIKRKIKNANGTEESVTVKTEKVTRITRGWQKLAVKRMSGLIFGIPVQRVYKPRNDEEKKAGEIIESIYQKCRIDSVNRQRAKRLYACCEFVTFWFTQPTPSIYADEVTDKKIRCKTYSPMDGDSLYPLFDEFGDLIALSIEYSRDEDGVTATYFETYTADEHIRWVASKETQGVTVEEFREPNNFGKIVGIYVKRDEPIWEGESNNVYEAEWALSRNGNYLRKNARPTVAICCDEQYRQDPTNKDNDGKSVIKLPYNAKMEYVTWNQATESLKYHVDSIKQNFFMQLQLPDLSYDNMKSQAMSGESRKMMFIDAQQKCLDESDIWLEGLDRETNVIRAIASQVFPRYEKAINSVPVEQVITPFQINDEMESVNVLTNATGGKPIMSQKTAIRRLGYVDDVDEELAQMEDEAMGEMQGNGFEEE